MIMTKVILVGKDKIKKIDSIGNTEANELFKKIQKDDEISEEEE